MIVPCRELMPVIRAALQRGQRVRMAVNGSSMLPFILDGDVVELEPLRSLPALGDMVLAHCPGSAERYVLHRVVRIEGQAFFLRGDAQQHSQGPFAQSDALGKVIVSYSNGHLRALDRGALRLAGLMWIYCAPRGPQVSLLLGRIQRFAASLLRRLRRIFAFRTRVKRFRQTAAHK